jgi:uncharacterized protein YbgA (DUF1722 family)/uncharacterized protein YbbK (DUF523 family)
METFPRPIVVVSKCIEFERVRYDGQMISSDFVKQLKDYVDFKPVCPEVEIGLGIPRESLRLVKKGDSIRLIQPSTGMDYTQRMELFSKHFLDSLGEVDGFILKSKSPSSAIKDARVYPREKDVAALSRGPGVFGKAILERYSDKAVEDEKRLLNERIREHFLTKLFTLSDFRAVKKAGSGNALVEFQAKNKLLLTAYNQVQLHIMGRLVGERKSRLLSETLLEYEGHLSQALKRPPNVGSNYNVLTKAAGYFTSGLTHEEKAFFLDTANKYKEGLQPFSAPLSIVKAWIVRFNETYLGKQTFFEPFPEKLRVLKTGESEEEKDYWK